MCNCINYDKLSTLSPIKDITDNKDGVYVLNDDEVNGE